MENKKNRFPKCDVVGIEIGDMKNYIFHLRGVVNLPSNILKTNRANALSLEVSTRAPTGDEDLSTAAPCLLVLNSTKRERWKRGEREKKRMRGRNMNLILFLLGLLLYIMELGPLFASPKIQG